MSFHNKLLYSLLLIVIISCNENTSKANLQPKVNVDQLFADGQQWWSYYYNDISLSSDYTSLDTNSVVITKDKFLSKLITGNYISVEMQSDSTSIYKLYKIPNETDEFISSTMKSQAQGEYQFFKMQDKAFPEFEAETLSGEKINNTYFKGKTTLIKTWFVACKPCIKEMPELNKLVNQYQNGNVQFLSLALDDEDALNKFLETTEFKYQVLPLHEELIENQLKLWGYPTHLVINSSGAIEKVFDKSEELMAYMSQNERSVKTQIHNKATPPPPPGGIEFENETDTN